jgi:DNA-binding MarR family transcriptional regulator
MSEEAEVRQVLRRCLEVVALIEPAQGALWQAAGVTLSQLEVLRRLRKGPCSTGRLASASGLSPASASHLLDRLEERGLVGRRRTDEDRRFVEVHLEPQGRTLLEGLHVLRGGSLQRAVEAMTDGERQRLLLALGRLIEGVRQVNDAEEAVSR